MSINLDKIEKVAPELVNLVKSSTLNLDKQNLTGHVAKVALVLDISMSMSHMYRNGMVHELVKRAIPLALGFDDDGQIDVFAFGVKSHEVGEYGLENYTQCVPDIQRKHPLEGGTDYSMPLDMLEAFYEDTEHPVYVMFVTDGETSNKSRVTEKIIELSKKPYFIQFIGLGETIFPESGSDGASDAQPVAQKKGLLSRLFGSSSSTSTPAPARTRTTRRMGSGFEFLSTLDEMDGRFIDNANFFAMKEPTTLPDDKLYELMLNEYPQWLKEARAKGIIA